MVDLPSKRVRHVPVSEFLRDFSRWSDTAQRGPVAITRHGRPFLAVLGYETWEELNREDEHRTLELRFLRAMVEYACWHMSLEEQQEAWQAASDFTSRPSPQFLSFIQDPENEHIRSWPARMPRQNTDEPPETKKKKKGA